MLTGTKLKVGPPEAGQAGPDPESLERRYRTVRAATRALSDPLPFEDQVIQSMPDVSPTKWHLAHTTWFFETFILKPRLRSYTEFHPQYDYLFNSYYHTVGTMHARPRRGLLSRPTVREVDDYRTHVDAAMLRLFNEACSGHWNEIAPLVELGLSHEQQHQELMLTDIKHVLSCNPLFPAAYDDPPASGAAASETGWRGFDGGIVSIGADGSRFAFDNESPRHDVLLPPFRLATKPVTNGEFLAFMEDGGYDRVDLWLSDGWIRVNEEGWRAPLYWLERDGEWFEFTLAGLKTLDPHRPVAHVSYYEADAYAAWAGARLPTEFELELAAASCDPLCGNQFDSPDAATPVCAPEPRPAGAADEGGGLQQVFGDVWEWSASAYAAYPGFRPLAGSLGEYNGKFMCNQLVLRGGSCATPRGHLRASYRNFFPPAARWQFSGIRLAAAA
jgi:ergothioneine biosynthesis protein EgtB